MYKKDFKRRLDKVFYPLAFFIAIIFFWLFFVNILHTPEYILPSPLQILNDLFSNFSIYLNHTSITFFEAIMGYLLANIIGFAIAVVFTYSKSFEKGLYPYAIALKTTPIIAIAPILIIWFGTGMLSKIITAAIICFFPILVNSVKGLSSIDESHLDLFKSFSANKFQIFTKLRLPNALPFIFSALKISAGLAVVGAIVGEFVGAKAGLGFLILTSSYYLDTTKMFTAVILSAILGMIIFYSVSFLEKRIVFWQKRRMH